MMLPALALLAASLCAAAADPAEKARRLHQQALRAHVDGKRSAALKKWRRCAELAPEGSRERNACALFADMHGENRPADESSAFPDAARHYRDGAAAFKKGRKADADREWRLCLESSRAGTGVFQDCLTALELVPRPAPLPASTPLTRSEETAGRLYMRGMVAYQAGEFAGAAGAWQECLQFALPGGTWERDCRAGLELLESKRRL